MNTIQTTATTLIFCRILLLKSLHNPPAELLNILTQLRGRTKQLELSALLRSVLRAHARLLPPKPEGRSTARSASEDGKHFSSSQGTKPGTEGNTDHEAQRRNAAKCKRNREDLINILR